MKRTKLAAVVLSGVMTLSLAAPAFASTYKVAAGDTLWHIAETQLGSGSKWSEIYEANKDSIKDPSLIYEGQEITIPDGKETPAAGTYTPGTYTGSGQGFGGTVTAEVTVSATGITSVKLTGANETAGIGGKALPTLEANAAAKGADMDGVAGATITSTAAKNAVTAALEKAAGPASEAVVKMKPGTYTAYADGFSLTEKVPVKVTVTEDKITAIEISEECSDTTIILRNVQELLVPRIIAAQSVAVDSITGATATSSAAKAGVTDCLKQALVAGGSDEKAVSAFQTPVAKANAGKQETLEGYDVVVVGIGGAGTMAAVSAAEQGLKVLAVEKAGKIGGTSVVTSAPMAINPTKFQAEFNEGKDYMDKEEMRTEWLKYTTDANGVQKAKPEVVDVMLDYSGETLDWLVYDHDFVFSTPGKGMTAADKYLCVYNYVGGRQVISNDRRLGAQAMYDKIMGEFADMGGELMVETEGTELIMENGKVTGIKATNLYDGTEYTIKASAVVLCTGGFAGNNDMVDEYISQNEFYDFSTPGGWNLYGMYQNDGKMIASAIANGAATYNIAMPPMVHNTATRNLVRDFPVTPADGTNILTGRSNTQSINDIPQIMSQVGNILVVGNEGKRIVNEAKMGQLGSWTNGREFYAIWSSTQIDDVKENGFKYVTLSRYLGQGGVTKETPMPQIYEVLEASIKANTAYKADTLEELAAMIGVPAENLVETVAKYNEACETGEDKEFGKTAEYLDAIGAGPYYCIVGAPYCYATCGGLEVDEKLNVLDTNGNPIEGLYACGEDSLGCMMSDDKAYVTYGGAAQGWALTSGYYVGKVLGETLAPSAGVYTPGTYTGTAQGFGGPVTAEVTVSANAITSVKLTGEKETPAIGGAALPTLEASAAAKGANMDAVAGASVTSDAAKAAVADCLAQAKGTETAVKMKPGTYTGEAWGFNKVEKIKVTVTVSEDAIEDIKVDTNNLYEASVKLADAARLMVPRILESQSVGVDTITGATGSSSGVRMAVAEALKKAIVSGDVSAFQKYKAPEAKEETLEYDVVVVGMGGSGSYAALRVAEEMRLRDDKTWANVLAIDKAGNYGGTTIFTSEALVVNPKNFQDEFNNGEDYVDADALYQDWTSYTTESTTGEQMAKPEMISLVMTQSGNALDWLRHNGFDFKKPAGGLSGGNTGETKTFLVKYRFGPTQTNNRISKDTFQNCFNHLYNKFTAYGGDYMLETEGYELMYDAETNSVTGVKAYNKVTNTTYTIKAKAVIVATGGFAGSEEMSTKYLGEEYYPLKGQWNICGSRQNDGKMIQAAIDVGAGTFNIGMTPVCHLFGPDGFLNNYPNVSVPGKFTTKTNLPAVWSEGDLPTMLCFWEKVFAVNSEGVRYLPENKLATFDAWKGGPDVSVIVTEKQIKDIAVNGIDIDDTVQHIKSNFDNLLFKVPIPRGTILPNAIQVMEDGVKAGFISKADTIEELAVELGLDPEVLSAEMAKYNEGCATGVDALGKPAEFLESMEEGPYYAIHAGMHCYGTCAGLNVNEKFQVLQADSETVINGLYSAGADCQGVIYSPEKAYVTYGGADNGWALLSGYMVGKSVVDDLNK